ncbi:putative membrane protein [Kutzneria buriramensis]|uniref:Putative membrane protein n=2 Tax=Kutzneria buriramensis TaxID=1045776 RepID=A0A3E0H0B6_9PSEU|nr:SHOCT domain-containing protein [Kutzneria buriramensis]REH34822.1 putative membrane protein [Kutzneria buriramensis]
MPWYYNGPTWLMPLTMAIGMAVFWGGLVTVVVLVLRRYGPQHRSSGAEQVLAERLARGEIDDKEYTRLRDILRTH